MIITLGNNVTDSEFEGWFLSFLALFDSIIIWVFGEIFYIGYSGETVDLNGFVE